MNIYNIPGLDGYKTAIAGWGLLIGGLGSFLIVLGGCLTGSLGIQECLSGLHSAWQDLVPAFMGLGLLGIGHKIEKK